MSTAKTTEQELQQILRTAAAEQRLAERRLKQWVKDHPDDPIAADIQSTLDELWAIRMDYDQACAACPNLDELVRTHQQKLTESRLTSAG